MQTLINIGVQGTAGPVQAAKAPKADFSKKSLRFCGFQIIYFGPAQPLLPNQFRVFRHTQIYILAQPLSPGARISALFFF